MLLSDFSIRQPVSAVAIILGLMFMGLTALHKLRVNEIPDVQMPVIVVAIPYPGASPDTVEREIVNRIEKSLQSIPQVYQIRSTAAESQATIVVIFNFKKNMVEAADEIRNSIASVRHKLPIEMREPILQRVDPDAQPVLQIALSSTSQSHAEISRLAADVLADRFRAVDGVASVSVNGALQRQLSVLLSAEKMRERSVSAAEVVAALRAQNTTAPVGRIKGVLDDQSIRLVGRIESPREFEQIVVRRVGEQMVRLGEVARIVDGYAEPDGYSLRNGSANVNLSVTRSRDASTVTVAEKCRALVEEINKTLPQGTRLDVTQDGGKDAESNLDNVIEALVFGAMLTVTVVYAFLNSWRSTLITALSLPTSVIAAFTAVWASGFTLNFMTLLGLSLAIGVLIDDAIVVRENIVRHMERGADRMSAARLGTSEIGMAVTATTLSIVAVFIPVAFMGGLSGEWFRPFALTVTTSVLVSLLVSFTLDPMLSAYWGDPVGYRHRPMRGLSAKLARFNDWFDHQANRYGNVIAWALHHRRNMALIAIASLVGAIVLQATVGGSAFLPPSDAGFVAIQVRTPSSASLDYARMKVEKAAELARTLPETVATNSVVDASGGRVYVDLGKRSERSRSA
ncbi:MAG TPA: efflux RND transporter permease subunit, partial [Rhodocyclaceae bacterium]|nr:efflux RND transporter permease subunit [Rhodocyclaceae bacterium]